MRVVFSGVALVLLTILQPAPIFAQAATQQHSTLAIAAGMAVKDPQGGMVGTITAINGDLVTVKTDEHAAQLPRASFTLDGDDVLFGMTQAQLNAAIEQQLTAANATIVPGVQVIGLQGVPVGTIDSMDDQYATVKLTSGKLIRLQRSSLAPAPQGVRIGTTAAALDMQVAASTAVRVPTTVTGPKLAE